MVDKVNNQVNWWQWEFWWAANQLNDVQWPNVAKMYSMKVQQAKKIISSETLKHDLVLTKAENFLIENAAK